jgi:hypothetical protein
MGLVAIEVSDGHRRAAERRTVRVVTVPDMPAALTACWAAEESTATAATE